MTIFGVAKKKKKKKKFLARVTGKQFVFKAGFGVPPTHSFQSRSHGEGESESDSLETSV